MRRFYGRASSSTALAQPSAGEDTRMLRERRPPSFGRLRARIAVYDAPAAPPRVEEVFAEDPRVFIDSLASATYELARRAGGTVPYIVIREIAENLIHADFREAVVTITDGGNTVRFSDQGPGIPDKERAMLPGFSTASTAMKSVIRGVGSGLPVARECLEHSGGSVTLDDNLGRGTVVTLSLCVPQESAGSAVPKLPRTAPGLSKRQKQILSLALELGSVGPSVIARELGVGLSTAHRDLEALERASLIISDASGKRSLTEVGEAVLARLLDGSVPV